MKYETEPEIAVYLTLQLQYITICAALKGYIAHKIFDQLSIGKILGLKFAEMSANIYAV